MDELHHHLAGRHRLDDALADRAFAHLGDEVLDHRQRDVGLEQGDAHFAHRLVDIGLRQRTAPGQLVEDAAQSFLQLLEHVALWFLRLAQNTVTPVRETRGPTGPLGAGV